MNWRDVAEWGLWLFFAGVGLIAIGSLIDSAIRWADAWQRLQRDLERLDRMRQPVEIHGLDAEGDCINWCLPLQPFEI